MESLQTFFKGVGSTSVKGNKLIQYRVSAIEQLEVILDNFDNFPLITQKWSDFILFKESFYLIQKKKHLTIEGLEKIISIKSSMNWGLNNKLIACFPNITKAARPLIKNTEIKHSFLLSGFVSAEGNFTINILNSKTKIGKQIILMFTISQHSKDANLLQSFSKFWGCGKYYPSYTRNEGVFSITKYSDIKMKIIPFFNLYPLQGVKALDLADFVTAEKIMSVKGHLTNEGLIAIEKLKDGINTKRNS